LSEFGGDGGDILLKGLLCLKDLLECFFNGRRWWGGEDMATRAPMKGLNNAQINKSSFEGSASLTKR
jgi:hypothetical protein